MNNRIVVIALSMLVAGFALGWFLSNGSNSAISGQVIGQSQSQTQLLNQLNSSEMNNLSTKERQLLSDCLKDCGDERDDCLADAESWFDDCAEGCGDDWICQAACGVAYDIDWLGCTGEFSACALACVPWAEPLIRDR